MAKVMVILSLLVLCTSQQQLIYPDQYELLRGTTAPPYFYPQLAAAAPQAAVAAAPAATASTVAAPVYAYIAGGYGKNVAAAASKESQQTPLVQTMPQEWANKVNDIIAKGVSQLALDIQNTIHANNAETAPYDNIIFSPLNIAGTLAVVHLASAGRTFDEVSKILGLATGVDISTHSELVHQLFGFLLKIIHEKVDEPSRTIDIASAIFAQKGYPIRPEFKTISEEVYNSEVFNLDFKDQPVEAQKRINSWVKDKTMGKIMEILNSPPMADTKVIIASALYFKAQWNQFFIKGATARKPFFIEPNYAINVDMMYNGGNFPFYEDKNLKVKIIGLPYKGLDITMYVLLPEEPGAIALGEFTKTMTPDRLEYLINNMKNETCITGMPRMKLSSSLQLKSVLQKLGLTSLFDQSTADLSLLSPGIGQRIYSLPEGMNPTMSTASSVAYTRPSKSTDNQDVLVFSRMGDEDDNKYSMTKKNFFKYHDKIRGYAVEQWATGFSIKKVAKRDTIGEDVWYFGKAGPRWKRQTRPVSDNFLKVIQNGNFRSYGLDNLRNSANLQNPGLYADEVVHKVEIDINEKGTEAAAASSVILRKDGRQKRLIANRPFIFFIRHNPTKLLLFWGSIITPHPSYPST